MNKYECTVYAGSNIADAMDLMIQKFIRDNKKAFDHMWPISIKVTAQTNRTKYEFEVWHD